MDFWILAGCVSLPLMLAYKNHELVSLGIDRMPPALERVHTETDAAEELTVIRSTFFLSFFFFHFVPACRVIANGL
jgi:hypothetical protein